MANPKISIITITYNSELHLEETINSIRQQNYSNLEYIIIDGGSTDGTHKIIERYKDFINVFVSEKDKGISDAFNKGINRSTGEIIGIINSDDLLEPEALNAIAEAYDPNVDIYSGNVLVWNDRTNQVYEYSPDIVFDCLKLLYKVAHPSRFIRKSAYEKWGLYSLDLKYKMDIDLIVRFAKAGAKFIHINRSLARFRKGGSTSHPIWKKRNDYYLFVIRNGWSEWSFRYIWCLAVMKYYAKTILSFCAKKLKCVAKK